MMPLNNFKAPAIENVWYDYTSSNYSYELKFIPEMEIRNRYDILCHRDVVVSKISSYLENIENPYQYDSLDLNVCVFDKSAESGQTYLSSYYVEIKLVTENAKNIDPDVLILPDFTSNESYSRKIKNFNNFR